MYKITIALSTITNSHPDILDRYKLRTEIENSMKEIPTDRSVQLYQAVMDCLKLLKSKKDTTVEDNYIPNPHENRQNRILALHDRILDALNTFRNSPQYTTL